MNKYLKPLMPTPAQWIASLVLPFILSIYFVFTRYSDEFVNTQGIDYEAIQDNVLATVFISGQLGEWITRFMDFAFWGVLASIALLIWWAISVAKTSVENHSTEQNFTNFQVAKESWHSHFVLVAVIKVVLAFLLVYLLFQILAKGIPQLASGIGSIVQQFNWANAQAVLWGLFLIVVYQLLFIVAIKLFRFTKAE